MKYNQHVVNYYMYVLHVVAEYGTLWEYEQTRAKLIAEDERS